MSSVQSRVEMTTKFAITLNQSEADNLFSLLYSAVAMESLTDLGLYCLMSDLRDAGAQRNLKLAWGESAWLKNQD